MENQWTAHGWCWVLRGERGFLVRGRELRDLGTETRRELYKKAKPYVFASYDEINAEYYLKAQTVPAAARVLMMFNIAKGDWCRWSAISPRTPAGFEH